MKVIDTVWMLVRRVPSSKKGKRVYKLLYAAPGSTAKEAWKKATQHELWTGCTREHLYANGWRATRVKVAVQLCDRHGAAPEGA